MDYLEDFLQKLYIYLSGKRNDKTGIVRIHTRKLQDNGDLSFPLQINNWCSLVGKDPPIPQTGTIFDLFDTNGQKDITRLVLNSKSWSLSIDRCETFKDNVVIYLDRTSTFKTIIEAVCIQKDIYGSVPCGNGLKFNVKCDHLAEDLNTNLSELRLKLLARVAENLIRFFERSLEHDEATVNSINFTLKSSNVSTNTSLCGSVLNNKGMKDITTTADDFYKYINTYSSRENIYLLQFCSQRTLDMRLMAEHKYGLRITSQPGWDEFFRKLGDAAVTIELLRNKPSHTLTTDVNNQFLASRKGAAFILYNCARLATLFKEFDRKASLNVYPELPKLEGIDFKLLTQPEEWELLYIHIVQFPSIIRNCMKDITRSKVYPNILIAALSSLCLCFSVYYRRVKVLVEPRKHVFPTMHARIYLLKAVEQVLHNGLRILDVQPVKQM